MLLQISYMFRPDMMVIRPNDHHQNRGCYLRVTVCCYQLNLNSQSRSTIIRLSGNDIFIPKKCGSA